MNIPFLLAEGYEELEKEFLDFCKSKNIVGVKGHRLVGGFRASTYNACTMEDVNALIAAMQEFEKAHNINSDERFTIYDRAEASRKL